MKKFLLLLSVCLPWPIRRWLLSTVFGYQIHPTARIGLCWIAPDKLIMRENSRIGHMTVCKGISLLQLEESATIGRGNWITGYPQSGLKHFTHLPERRPQLVIERHAAITNRHIIDCTDSVRIGAFSILAGFQSQILTHSVDLQHSRQSCSPVEIGSYCFVGTNSVILGGAALPHHCVLGANSLLNKSFEDRYQLYGGVPARPIQAVSEDLAYFQRLEGFIN
jgi:serine acetyltransferase